MFQIFDTAIKNMLSSLHTVKSYDDLSNNVNFTPLPVDAQKYQLMFRGVKECLDYIPLS